MMRLFETHSSLRNYRLCKIGFHKQHLFICPHRDDCIEIWSLHSFIPNSWRMLTHYPLIELLYAAYTISHTQPFVYALVVALFDCDVPRISVLKISIESGEVDVYNLDESSGNEFENKVYLENIIIGCGDETLFMYDRSVVMGPIPFWTIHLIDDTKTFVIESEAINANENEERCSRFPIILNGDKRKLLKICDNNQIIIYDDNDNIWNIYTPSPYSHIELSEVTMARGVSETYGRSGHRMGAVESLMNLFTDRDTCIAKIFKNGKHTFYCIQFDDQRKTYCVLPASSCQLPTSIQRRFYAACTSTQFVFICSKGIAFVPLKPSTLKEICFLSLQLNFCKSNSDGILSGGISEQQIKDLCFCKYQHSLV